MGLKDQEVKQKPIIHYLQEEEVPEKYREKVLLAVTRLVYERNQEAIEYQKTKEEVRKKEILDSLRESDKIIREKIHRIMENKEDDEKCVDCLDF